MTKTVDAWMPLLVDKYLGDTTHMNTEQHGAYLLLLMAMWKRDGSLPADDVQLAQITRLPPAKWRAHRAVLMLLFKSDGESITQKRLTEELQRAKALSEAKAEAGAKGAAKRWQSHSKGMAEPLANASLIDTPIPIPIPREKKKRETRASRLTPLPEGFGISERVRTWAQGKGLNHLDDQLEAFLSYARRKGAKYVDWDEALMTAIREDWAKKRIKTGSTEDLYAGAR